MIDESITDAELTWLENLADPRIQWSADGGDDAPSIDLLTREIPRLIREVRRLRQQNRELHAQAHAAGEELTRLVVLAEDLGYLRIG